MEQKFIYEIAANEEETSLCRLEMRSLFGKADYGHNLFVSPIPVDPSRSPFIKRRIEVIFESGELDSIAAAAATLNLEGTTFKVVCTSNRDPGQVLTKDFEERRSIERKIGARMRGTAEMRSPGVVFGIVRIAETWYFGRSETSTAVWLKHKDKPRQYSTALSTRVARAIVNIAVPRQENWRVIDPCCGIGTVLIEACSMGIDIEGRDLNPLAAQGARENLAYFGYVATVTLGDMRDIAVHYDAAIVDMPYNLCSVLSDDEKLVMLRSARGFADKVVVVSSERLDAIVEQAGLKVADRGVVSKGNFVREILVCIPMTD